MFYTDKISITGFSRVTIFLQLIVLPKYFKDFVRSIPSWFGVQANQKGLKMH